MLLRLCSMLRSRWPMHSVLSGTFGGFLSHNALFLCQDFIGVFIYHIGPFCVYYNFWFCVFMRFLCVWMSMPLPLCVSWTFSLPAPKFVCSVLFVWFVCFHFLLLLLLLFIYLLLLFILDVCLYSNEKEKQRLRICEGGDVKRIWENLGSKSHNQNTFCEKILFSIKI